jgi:hypothetical protein
MSATVFVVGAASIAILLLICGTEPMPADVSVPLARLTDAQGNVVDGLVRVVSGGFRLDEDCTMRMSGTTRRQGRLTLGITHKSYCVVIAVAGDNGASARQEVNVEPHLADAQYVKLATPDSVSYGLRLFYTVATLLFCVLFFSCIASARF